MVNCAHCTKRKWVKAGKWKGNRRVWKCFFCGHEQAEDEPFIRQKPKILYIDLEISLSEMYNFGLKVQGEYVSPDFLKRPYYCICWAASWVGENIIHTGCVTSQAARRWSDKQIMGPLWALMDRADIIAGHNVKFDIKRSNTRFILNKLPPPLEYQTIDTLKIARGKFAFESNKLDHISQVLGFRPKDAMSKKDWLAIAERGDEKTLQKMSKYNAGDVREGKRVLSEFMGWTSTPDGSRSLPKPIKGIDFIVREKRK
jgi:hypothetical protein